MNVVSINVCIINHVLLLTGLGGSLESVGLSDMETSRHRRLLQEPHFASGARNGLRVCLFAPFPHILCACVSGRVCVCENVAIVLVRMSKCLFFCFFF